MVAQLILPMGVDDRPGQENFLDTPNKSLLSYLKELLRQRAGGELVSFSGVYIWGEPSSGKSHLLSALFEWAGQGGGSVIYLDSDFPGCGTHTQSQPERIYLLDDVEMCIQDGQAERTLLTMLEGIRQQNSMLLMTARRPVSGLNIGLPDLSSRMQAMEHFQLLTLCDEDKRAVLRQRASQRGIVLSEEVLNWLFSHTVRELSVLLDLLERIDVFSLEQKRKVTIPLIKSILEP